jgi:hypothetical protein
MRIQVIGLIVFILSSFSARQARGDEAPTLGVQVRNYSRADGEIVAAGEAIAGRAFKDAGIWIVWFASSSQIDLGRPSKLTLQIFQGHSGRPDLKDALGSAMTDTNPEASFLADIFLGNIEENAVTRTDETVLLGFVMAHEIGHLLGAPHERGTIMVEGWRPGDFRRMRLGSLRFSEKQAERLRAAVLARERNR